MKARIPGWQGRVVFCLAVLSVGLCGVQGGEATAPPWPKSIDTPQGRCTLFQPQPTALQGDRLSARVALAVASGESTNVVFGIAQLQARAAQAPDSKQTTFSEVALTQAKFAPADAPAMAGLADALKPELAKLTWTMSAEELQAGLDVVERERTAARGINHTPPTILYSSVPAVLVLLDGPPQLRSLTNSPLMRAVNTPYAMLFQPAEKRYWLQGSYEWFAAPDWRGEWKPVAQPPAEVVNAVPKASVTNAPALGSQTGPSPRIVVSSEPAELLVTRGEPTYTPVDGSELLYVSNSDQLLFLALDTKEYYVAFSGRWYRSATLNGSWDAVASDKLPPAFARIPPGSPKSEALTYVAGTVEAEDAVLQASIPQITAVGRDRANTEVKYDGAPRFQPVESTGVQYATNTVDAVFLVGGSYYLCRDAVWYTGASAEGPWSVATTVPPEIQSLPPSNPHYNVKYVYVYGSTPEEVYVGYVPGYAGSYVYGPTVVYGTGWWYPGYYGPSYCWSYPATFGFGFGYNSWSGWSVGFGFSYGWLGCSYGWGWGGCYPSGWWGPCGAYWACAPRYPHYGGYHHGNGGYGHHGGAQPPPHPGGTRAEVRKDAPGPAGRPTNLQRRTLPTYARTAKAAYQPSSALRSARGIESVPGLRGGPSAAATPTRTEAANGSRQMPQRTSPGRGEGASPASRSVPGNPAAALSNTGPRANVVQPGRSTPGASTTLPARSGSPAIQTPSANQAGRAGATAPAVPTRGTGSVSQRSPSLPATSWPGARPNVTGIGSPTPAAPSAGRYAAPTVPSVYGRSPVSTSAPMRSWPGATPTYAPSAQRSSVWSPSFATTPAYGSGPSRSSMSPSGYGGSAPSMRAPMAAPSAPMRGGSSSGFSAPSRSSSGPSGGSMSRGGSPRGR